MVSVRYIVDDVLACTEFYVQNFGFTGGLAVSPFAEISRGNLRLLLSGPASSAGQPLSDGEMPQPGGWNRIHFIVDDINAEVAQLSSAGVRFRNNIVSGRGGSQVLAIDPAGNLIEIFQPAARA